MKVIKFGATWCGPCKMYNPVFNTVSKSLPQIEFESIDIDEDPIVTAKYKITAVPSTIIVNNDGTELAKENGVMPVNQLVDFINGFLK